ncbi:hypothetical protein L1887_21914 [Cichorium endivia]|nr:hypothetical protein L1887_21914 [Cichorium endivia]
MKQDNLNEKHHNIISFADMVLTAGGLQEEEGMNMIDFESATADHQISKNVGRSCINKNTIPANYEYLCRD